MTGEIALLLAQDGLTNGAIYALLALALVLVYSVTRVVFVPQGQFVAVGGLTLAALEAGNAPRTIWLLLGLGLCVFAIDAWNSLRTRNFRSLGTSFVGYLLWPAVLAVLCLWLAHRDLPMTVQMLLTVAIVTTMGPLVYRIFFQPIANAPVLLLLIVAVAVDFALHGVSLVLFGPEGFRTTPIFRASFPVGVMSVSAQSLWVISASALLIVALYIFFGWTIRGKALRATAINRVGAKIVGIPTESAGLLCFALAAAIGAISGILLSPMTTLYYDSGFLIGLKGFVAAIIGGLLSYPIAAAGALLVGLLESFSSFWASNLKEVIVFTLIIPVLLVRSLTRRRVEGDED